jgi:polar amino acid transport system ATP-binding protein
MKLEVENLRKHFGATRAADDLSLAVQDTRVLALIGPSGGGKSTLLRLLGGLEVPDGGSIRINGSTLSWDEKLLRAYRRKNGFVFQQFNLFPHMTARRNIELPLEEVHQLTKDQAKQLAKDALFRFGLEEHADKLPSQLSGGQQQRVGIARAVAKRPEVLFLDEPTSALDPEMTAEVLELIQELALAGQDIVLSTHEMGFARAASDQVAFVASGKIAELAAPKDLFGAPKTEVCKRFLSRVMRY